MSIFNLILPTGLEPTPPPVNKVTSYPTSCEADSNVLTTNYTIAIGKGADTADRTENIYSNSSGAYGTVKYYFDFSAVPDTATITNMSIQVKGHQENSDGEAEVVIRTPNQSWGGTTTSFTSTSSRVYTLPSITMTVAELKEAYMAFTVGRDGGLVEGVTWEVTYEI